jgi:predicted RNase H-like nuclease (RuvC/YqgF family)
MDYVKVKKGGVSKTIPQNAVDDHRRQGYKVIGAVPGHKSGGVPAAVGVAELEQALADARQSFRVVEAENAQLQAEVESLKEGSGDLAALQAQLEETQDELEQAAEKAKEDEEYIASLQADLAAANEQIGTLESDSP